MTRIALCLVGTAALLGGLVATGYTLGRHRTLLRPGYFLAVAAAGAVAAFTLTTAWLIASDKATSHSDDIRTGGIAAAAVVALYGLWLNDRRRRVDEDRNQTERERLEQDRARNAAEHFTRAVELLGNADEAVRLGALHSLAALGRGRPELVQPVLDVYCAYLRMPPRPAPEDDNGDRLWQVRLTAQRLIRDLLADRTMSGADRRLDLSGALLRDFELTGVIVHTLVATGANWDGRTTFEELRVTGECSLASAKFTGPFSATGAAFGKLTVGDTHWTELADLSRVTIGRSIATGTVRFERGVRMTGLMCDEKFAWRIDCAGAAECADTTFRNGLDIAGSRFTGSTTFHNAVLGDSTNFDRVNFADVDLRATRLPEAFTPRGVEAAAERDDIRLPMQLDCDPVNPQRTRWRIRRATDPS